MAKKVVCHKAILIRFDQKLPNLDFLVILYPFRAVGYLGIWLGIFVHLASVAFWPFGLLIYLPIGAIWLLDPFGNLTICGIGFLALGILPFEPLGHLAIWGDWQFGIYVFWGIWPLV